MTEQNAPVEHETRYTQSTGGVNIAYQVLGDAERDLVLVPGWIFNLEVVWEHPSFEAFMKRLLRNFRVIMFDKRGTGLSDRAVVVSSMEERMDDVRAVMDAAGSDRAALMGWSEGGNIAGMFAATYPDRADGLVLHAAGARYRKAPDYPFGMTDEFIEMAVEIISDHWGQGLGAYFAAPSRADDESFRRWFGRYERLTVSPGAGLATLNANLDIDTTAMLRLIQVPTLVMHNVRDALVPVEFSRYVADQVPDSKLIELDGDDHLFWFDNPDAVVSELETFLLGQRTEVEPERVLSTVLFTDIVGSTEIASRMGDARWTETLDIHDRIARESLEHFRGTLIKTTGDGLLATFDGPARAVTCAARLRRSLDEIGVPIRAGVHTGEVELRGPDVGGLAVHIAARIVDVAEPGEILASRTVKDLAAGAGIVFTDRGVHELKGIPESRRLFSAEV